MDKPEALRLADELESSVGTQSTYSAMQQAAAELRRQHEEITQLRHGAGVANQTIVGIVAQRAALLEALKRVLDRFDPYAVPGYETNVAAEEKARAAIASVEGVKT